MVYFPFGAEMINTDLCSKLQLPTFYSPPSIVLFIFIIS